MVLKITRISNIWIGMDLNRNYLQNISILDSKINGMWFRFVMNGIFNNTIVKTDGVKKIRNWPEIS